MTKNPFYNAILAGGYICLIATLMNFLSTIANQPEDNIFMPIAMLSLFVLSASVMAFIFFYHPVIFILEGKKMEAAKLIAYTIGIFAVITLAFGLVALLVLPNLG